MLLGSLALSRMPEIGLVRFAGVALQVSQAALPQYRTKFSKRQFTQPQLLAVLCLMRYEDWTFRETAVRLTEHGELRHALQFYTLIFTYARRGYFAGHPWRNSDHMMAGLK